MDAGLRCKQLLFWACLIAVLQMGLEKLRGDRPQRLAAWPCQRAPGAAQAHAGKQEWGRESTRSKNPEKRSQRGEPSLRLCGIALSCEPAIGGSKNASPGQLAINQTLRRACEGASERGSQRASYTSCSASSPAPKACLLGCRSLVHGGSTAGG